MQIRCLIVDDNDAFLRTASGLLEREGLAVVGVATTAADALDQARALKPDVVLVDIVLGDESGFDVVQALARADGGAASLILISTHSEGDLDDLIERAPVAGFLSKSRLSGQAIRQLLR